MPLDPNILLAGRPVTPPENPISTIGQVMQIRNMGADYALHQAQMQNVQAEAQQRNKDLADQATIQDWLKDPQNGYAYGKGDLSGLQGKIQPKTLLDLQTKQDTALQQHAVLTKTQLENHQTVMNLVENGFDGLMQAPDDATAAAQYQGLRQRLIEDGAPVEKLPETIRGKEDIQNLAAQLNIAKGLNDAALSRQQKQTAIAANQAEADLKKAQTPGEQAKSQLEQTKADLWKAIQQNPQALDIQIDREIPPAKYPDENRVAKTAAHSAGDYDKAQAAIKDSADRIGRLETAVAQAKATQPIKVEASGVEAGRAAALKSAEELNAAKTTAQNLQSLIDAAKAGNKAAGSNLPLMGVEALNAAQNIKRINRTEVEQYEGAGNLLDTIKGKLGKLVSGQPIPQDVLDDISKMHQIILNGAITKHNLNLSSIEGAYPGTKFQREPMPSSGGTEPPAKTVEKWVRDAKGNLVKQ